MLPLSYIKFLRICFRNLFYPRESSFLPVPYCQASVPHQQKTPSAPLAVQSLSKTSPSIPDKYSVLELDGQTTVLWGTAVNEPISLTVPAPPPSCLPCLPLGRCFWKLMVSPQKIPTELNPCSIVCDFLPSVIVDALLLIWKQSSLSRISQTTLDGRGAGAFLSHAHSFQTLISFWSFKTLRSVPDLRNHMPALLLLLLLSPILLLSPLHSLKI